MTSGVYERQKVVPLVRFSEKWTRSMTHSYNEEPCWEWNAGKHKDGYGEFKYEGKRVLSHIWSYEHYREAIPEGLELDHLCRVRHCVNPSHLEPVTHQENCRRGDVGQHNSLKICCPKGHLYDAENTYLYRGRRYCRICNKANNAK